MADLEKAWGRVIVGGVPFAQQIDSIYDTARDRARALQEEATKVLLDADDAVEAFKLRTIHGLQKALWSRTGVQYKATRKNKVVTEIESSVGGHEILVVLNFNYPSVISYTMGGHTDHVRWEGNPDLVAKAVQDALPNGG